MVVECGYCLELKLNRSNSKEVGTEYDQLVQDMCRTSSRIGTVVFKWVCREVNGAAHSLARRARHTRGILGCSLWCWLIFASC